MFVVTPARMFAQLDQILTRDSFLRPGDYHIPRSPQERLFDRPRTGDENLHQPPGALLPVRVGRQVGDADQRAAMLKLYTIYSPPNHPDETVHKTKAEAEAAELVEHRQNARASLSKQRVSPVEPGLNGLYQ